MGHIPKHEELAKLTEEDLVRRYNVAAENTVVGTGFYRDEIVRRGQQRQNDQMLAFTKQMRDLTIWIAILTIVNTMLVAVSMHNGK
ncbi:MAG: hypothetical protein AAB262_13745 [Elusimicrobiota bacterium]